MLINLHVKNFALIDEAEIDFQSGLNILTGETGAGKSILIDAVNSALGGRVGPEVIRSGADSAYVELVFSVSENDRKQQLEELGVSTEYDCIVVSRRILPGRSVHKINDETVTSAKVRAVTELLLDIHGQHEHQSLLKSSKQRDILDSFGGSQALMLRELVREAYGETQRAQKRLSDFNIREEDRLRKLDFLRYEIEELESSGAYPGELSEKEEEFRRMNHFERIEGALRSVIGRLGEGEAGCADRIGRAQRELQTALQLDPGLADLAQELTAAEDILSCLCRELEDYLNASAFDEARFRELGSRLDQLRRLETKYGPLERLDEYLEERRREMRHWENYEAELEEAEESFRLAQQRLEEACARLTQQRQEAAPRLEQAISHALLELNFLSVHFEIQLTPLDKPGDTGAEEVSFLISMNPGERPQPLNRVASGGELSRIMLAIKAILADKDEIPTVIFDEIDTGISGRTAQMVGRKLKAISTFRQVILITHLPQIAALADVHIGISKWTDGAKTYSGAHVLTEEESVEELARLLGGEQITETVRMNAREMKALGGSVSL